MHTASCVCHNDSLKSQQMVKKNPKILLCVSLSLVRIKLVQRLSSMQYSVPVKITCTSCEPVKITLQFLKKKRIFPQYLKSDKLCILTEGYNCTNNIAKCYKNRGVIFFNGIGLFFCTACCLMMDGRGEG